MIFAGNFSGGFREVASVSPLRGLIVRYTYDSFVGNESPAPGRQLRARRQNHLWRRTSSGKERPGLRLPASCTSWPTFSRATMAERCAKDAFPHRDVIHECGGGHGGLEADAHVSSALAAAQAAEFYTSCESPCVYHPETPITAGWVYDAGPTARCFRPWRSGSSGEGDGFVHPNHECVQSLLDRPSDLARMIGRAARGCALDPLCRPPVPVSTQKLRASGCAPRHIHRNLSSVCAVGEGGGERIGGGPSHANGGASPSGGASIDLARAQVNGMWDKCAARCVYSPDAPAAAGWIYEPSHRCFRAWYVSAADQFAHSGTLSPLADRSLPRLHECLNQRRKPAAQRIARISSELCGVCGEPQRREPCHELVRRHLQTARQQQQQQQQMMTTTTTPSKDTADADAAAASARLYALDYDSVQAKLAAEGRCRMPCLPSLIPSPLPPKVPKRRGRSLPSGEKSASAHNRTRASSPISPTATNSSSGGSWIDEMLTRGGHATAAAAAPSLSYSSLSSSSSGFDPSIALGSMEQRWVSVPPVWLGAMRLDWTSSRTSARAARAAVLKVWVAHVRRQLDLGAARASTCASRLLQPRAPRTTGFIELSDAREQMHKNKFVVSDALYIAHVLGRALVEPHVSDSRLGNERPTSSSAVSASAASAAAFAVSSAVAASAAANAPSAATVNTGTGTGTDAAARTEPSGVEAGGGSAGKELDDTTAVAARSSEDTAEEEAEAAADARAAAARASAAAASAAADSAALADADQDGARRFSGLVLRHYWDLEPLCARFDLVPRAVYNRYKRGGHVVVAPREANRGIGLWRLHSRAAVQRAFGGAGRARTIEIKGMWRSVTNTEALRDATLPYQGVPLRPSSWELNPAYELLALTLIHGLMDPEANGRFLAVQWRSEDWQKQVRGGASAAAAPDALRPCAQWAAARIKAEMAKHNLTEAFLATDLRGGASGTYATGAAQADALRVLHRAVPSMRNERLRAFLDAIPDAGVRANLETAICLKATAMLATTGRCKSCGHARRCAKMSSAFGHYIVERRKTFMRPTEPLF